VKENNSCPEIHPRQLVVVKHNNRRIISRVVRCYTQLETPEGYPLSYSAINSGKHEDRVKAVYVELLSLVDLDNMRVCREKQFTYTYRLSDVQVYDRKLELEIAEDLASRVRRVQEQIRLYQSTIMCDPGFNADNQAINQYTVRQQLQNLPKKNAAEILQDIYGECYPDAHTRVIIS
jgi:hypothetical protein